MNTMAKCRKLRIELTEEQRKSLEQIVSKSVSGAMEIRRANVLLLANEAGERKRKKDVVIARMLGITVQAVHDIKVKFLERRDSDKQDPAKGIRRKKRATLTVPAKCTGDMEARIIAIACSAPPEGRGDGRSGLYRSALSSLKFHIPCADLTHSRKNGFKPHLKKMWCIPRTRTPLSSPTWKMCLKCTRVHTTP